MVAALGLLACGPAPDEAGDGGRGADLPSPVALAQCLSSPGPVALDHVVLAVRDLASATGRFEALGFNLKPGRLHPNTIRNAHAKFRDGTEIELLTASSAEDEISRGYMDFLDDGDGGAFLAFRITDGRGGGAGEVPERTTLDALIAEAEAAGVPALSTESPGFRYVTFPTGSGAGHLFVVQYGTSVEETEDVFSHPNGSAGTLEVWIDPGPRTGDLLLALGADHCGLVSGPEGEHGTAYALGSTRVVVLDPASSTTGRPRVQGVVLATTGQETVLPVDTVGGIWIRLQPK